MRRGMGILIVLLAVLVAIAIGVGAYNAGLHQAVVESGRAGESPAGRGNGSLPAWRHSP